MLLLSFAAEQEPFPFLLMTGTISITWPAKTLPTFFLLLFFVIFLLHVDSLGCRFDRTCMPQLFLDRGDN